MMRDQPKGDWHVAALSMPYVEHSDFFESGHCTQGPPRYERFELLRKGPRRGGEALPGVSLPPWKASATRKTMMGGSARVTAAQVAVRAQVTLWDASSFSQDSRSMQNPLIKIPPPEASENPWQMLLVKGPPNSEEQWKRSVVPIPSRFHPRLSSLNYLGCRMTGLPGKQRPPRTSAATSKGKLSEEATSKSGTQVRCASLAALTSL